MPRTPKQSPNADALDALHAQLTALWERYRAGAQQPPILLRDIGAPPSNGLLDAALDVFGVSDEALEIAALALTAARACRAAHQRAGAAGGRGRASLTDKQKTTIRTSAAAIRLVRPYARNGEGSTRWLADTIARKHRLPPESVRNYLRTTPVR